MQAPPCVQVSSPPHPPIAAPAVQTVAPPGAHLEHTLASSSAEHGPHSRLPAPDEGVGELDAGAVEVCELGGGVSAAVVEATIVVGGNETGDRVGELDGGGCPPNLLFSPH